MQLNLPASMELGLIPSGPPGIAATLRIMGQKTREGKKSLTVREKAASLVAACQQKDWSCEVRALHGFVRDNIRYLQDIDGIETVQGAEYTLERGFGDCDDKSVLLASLLGAIGHPSRFVAIGFAPGEYSHVYVETLIGATWIPLETTEPVEVGWQPDPKLVVERMIFWN